MGLSSRYYLFADDGLYRMSNRVASGLVSGELVLPQYAGTKQRVAIVVLQNEGKKPAKILEAQGRYYSFDPAGNAAEAFGRGVTDAMGSLPALANLRLSDIDKSSTVVDIGSELTRERFIREHRWELTTHDLDRIAADIWKKPMVAEKVRDVKAVASKTPKHRGVRLPNI
jgi:hypothetical protein